jgi:superfamily II DNA or RNA helicase
MKYMRELFSRIVSGDTPADILKDLTPQNKGHIGEGLLRLLILLGIHPTDPSRTVIPYKATPATRRLESIASISERIEILTQGLINSGGSNKIDVCWRDNEEIAVCSSKIGKLRIKSIADLEIGAMLSEFTESGGYTENGRPVSRETVRAYVLVDCAEEVATQAEKSKASNKVSKDNLNPIDTRDLTNMCAVLAERLDGCPSKDIESVVGHLMSDEKPSLHLRFHQRLICSKVKHLIVDGHKTILIGALPRSGKTWMGAHIAKQYNKILIITTRPGETRMQWNNVFKRHREFSSYVVENLDSSTSGSVAAVAAAPSAKIVAVASAQYMKGEETSTRQCLIGLQWDIVLLDEIHEGGATDRTNDVLETYIGPSPIRIMMTATYTKPVEYYSIPEECCCFWDLEDVRLMRSWSIHVEDRLCEKYGAEDVAAAAAATDDYNCYKNAPRLGVITNMMQTALYEELRVATQTPDNVYGFSMRSLFMPTKDGTAFQNQKAVDTFLALISGSNKLKHYKKGNMSIFARILRYWKAIGHRGGDEFMTQIWFLPYGVGQHVGDVKQCMIDRIGANQILREFAVMKLDAGMGDISQAVAANVVEARAAGKRGLILLTGNVGSLGVSLPEVDVALMLHDIESADMTYQQMMRVLTEAGAGAAAAKKCGIVVDFNVWRVLTMLNTYATSRCGQSEKSSVDRIRWCISHLIDIDADLWECTESPEVFAQHKIADELTAQWRKMLEQTGTCLHVLARKAVDLGDDQRELDQIARHLEEGCSGATRLEVNPEQEALATGIEQRASTASATDDTCSDDTEEEEPVLDITKKANINDVLARLIPEIAVLAGQANHDLLEALTRIHANAAQREALNEFLRQLYS